MGTPTDPLLGKVIGGYCLEELLGRGKLTAVYRATTTELCQISELLVIIFLLPETISSQIRTRFKERFFREAQRLASLHFPSIVPLYGYGEYDEYLYFLSPDLPGETLEALLKHKKDWTATEALSLLMPIARTLDYLHQRGCVYQCFHPGHVILQGNASAEESAALQLNGLGLFQILRMHGLGEEEDLAALEHLKSIAGPYLGLPAYLAPEIVKGEEGDARSDVYSLGALLFELLSGQPLFTGETYEDIARKHIEEPLPSLHEVAPHLPIALELVVNRALHRNAELRFQTPGELLTVYSLVLSERVQAPQAPYSLLQQIEKIRTLAAPAFLKHLQLPAGALPLQIGPALEQKLTRPDQLFSTPDFSPLPAASVHGSAAHVSESYDWAKALLLPEPRPLSPAIDAVTASSSATPEKDAASAQPETEQEHKPVLAQREQRDAAIDTDAALLADEVDTILQAVLQEPPVKETKRGAQKMETGTMSNRTPSVFYSEPKNIETFFEQQAPVGTGDIALALQEPTTSGDLVISELLENNLKKINEEAAKKRAETPTPTLNISSSEPVSESIMMSQAPWLNAMLRLLPQTTAHDAVSPGEKEAATPHFATVAVQAVQPQGVAPDEAWLLAGPSSTQYVAAAATTALLIPSRHSSHAETVQQRTDQMPRRDTGQLHSDRPSLQTHEDIATMTLQIQQLRQRLQASSPQHLTSEKPSVYGRVAHDETSLR